MSDRNVTTAYSSVRSVCCDDVRQRGIKEHSRFESEVEHYYSPETDAVELSFSLQRLHIMYVVCGLVVTCGVSIAALAYLV